MIAILEVDNSDPSHACLAIRKGGPEIFDYKDYAKLRSLHTNLNYLMNNKTICNNRFIIIIIKFVYYFAYIIDRRCIGPRGHYLHLNIYSSRLPQE